MTDTTIHGQPALTIPGWTLGWRLRRALAAGEISTAEMADHLGVTPTTISRWCNDKGAPPRAVYVRAWAERCRVPYEWLAHGIERELPHLDSNQEPSDSGYGTSPVSTDELKSLFLKRLGHTGVIRSADRSRRVVGS